MGSYNMRVQNMITVFTCKDEFEDMMTCIYDAWNSRLGHSNIRLMIEPIAEPELFCDYIHITADPQKVVKVVRSIQKKISYHAYQTIYSAAMSFRSDKLDIIYRFLILGFHYGPAIMDMLQEPAVMAAFELNRKVGNEAHYFKEFIRFSSVDNRFFISHIEPKCNVLTLVAPHFSDRMPSENWMIIDDKRHLAAVQTADESYYLTPLGDEEFTQLLETKHQPDIFIDLWKGFFQTIAIEERANYRCQRNMMPLWYRKNAIEFL